MAHLEIDDLTASYGAVPVLKGISLKVEKSEVVSLIGPSGSGKSTLLRALVGVTTPSGGRVRIADTDVDYRSPASLKAARDCMAIVFQQYNLFQNMSVMDNVTIAPVKIKKWNRDEVRAHAAELLERVGLAHKHDAYPDELSGGQRQRVAIGRAIVGEPETFLFDEPLSNLDAELRVHMRTQISELHERLKRTMIYVTHDQVEAMTLADKIVLLRDGRIEQVGTPHDLYERPQNLFAAQFIGAPKMNIFELTGSFEGLRAAFGLDRSARYCGIRPDSLTIAPDGEGALAARVRLTEYLGNARLVHADVEGHGPVILEQPAGAEIATGSRIALSARRDSIHAFRENGNRIE